VDFKVRSEPLEKTASVKIKRCLDRSFADL
jgi:hypothetical protein